jgi:hypothetical protein
VSANSFIIAASYVKNYDGDEDDGGRDGEDRQQTSEHRRYQQVHGN